MHSRWPRFWVDSFQGFNYHLVKFWDAAPTKYKADSIPDMARKEVLGTLSSRQCRLRVVDCACRWGRLLVRRLRCMFLSLSALLSRWWKSEVLILDKAKIRNPKIFAINTIIPMLSIVYWKGEFPTRYQFGLNSAMLIGSLVGQITFGMMADRYGRRKVYGLELIVTIGASLGFATASAGVKSSMSLIALLIFWRAVSTPFCRRTLQELSSRLTTALHR